MVEPVDSAVASRRGDAVFEDGAPARSTEGRRRTDQRAAGQGVRGNVQTSRSDVLNSRATTAHGERGARLAYLPGIDGLRAISVLAVLCYHYRTNRSLLRGGFLGVEVFFVISGYLITSLLMAESRSWKRIDLRRFWGRRIRRLWPALIVMMLVVGFVVAVFYHEDLGHVRGDLAFGFYGENWWHILHGVSYVDLAADVGKRQPFQHLWSLAVEEQFYVVWPLIFTVGLTFGVRRLRIFTVGLVVASWLLMVWFALHGNENHAYLGTETRAYGPLTGALLAFVYPPGRRKVAITDRAVSVLDFAGIGALAGLFALFVFTRQTSTWLYVGGFPLTDLFTALLIVVLVHPAARLGRFVGAKPLQWIGLRSYGIYLWGIAIFEFTRPGLDLHASPLVELVLRVVLVAVVVELSFRLIETPVRGGAFRAAWQDLRTATGERRRLLARRWQVGGAMAAVLALFVGATAFAAQPPNTSEITGGHVAVGGGDCVVTGRCAIPTAPTTMVVSTTQPSVTSAPVTTAKGSPTTKRSTPTTAPGSGRTTTTIGLDVSHGWKVAAVGDSVMLGGATALEHTLTGPVQGAVLVNAEVSRHAGTCLQVLQAFANQGRLGPLVLVHCGNNGALGPGFVDQVMRIAGKHRRVVFFTLKVPRSWQDTDNAELHADVARYSNARIFDWHTIGTSLTPQDKYFYADGYHLTPAGRTFYADHVLNALKVWHWL